MPRADLLALTEDDLAALTNRGTVKRALRELDEGAVAAEIVESPAGDVTVTWSDGIICELPAGATLHDSRCSSGAAGISRHLVRSVFAYQRGRTSAEPTQSTPTAWDPGAAISDAMLDELFRKADLTRAKQRFAAGVLVELVRGVKPLARFLDEPCTLRFMVPGDARYVHADCSPQALPLFVPLAVWAFRELPPEKTSGLVSFQLQPPATPTAVLDDVEQFMRNFAADGVANTSPTLAAKLTRLEAACCDEGLTWPAEIAAELGSELQRYQSHDALFEIDRVTELIGELLIRSDAIRSGCGDLPQTLVRGTRSDHLKEIGAARLTGLGCGVRVTRQATELTAYLQDIDTGSVVAVQREFAQPKDEAQLRDFAELASAPVVRGVSLAGIGGGQLLIKGGKRTPGCRLALPRTGVSAQPQAFAWEKLRPPILSESFAETAALLALLPPRTLRPRRVTEDVFVFAVRGAKHAHFDSARQLIIAELEDALGGTATLAHPFSSRAAGGTEALLAALEQGESLKFLSGRAKATGGGLVIEPLCAVFERDGERVAVQPWIDPRTTSVAGNFSSSRGAAPAADILREWLQTLGELWLSGLARVTPAVARQVEEIAGRLESAGYLRFAERTQTLAADLQQRATDPRWSPANAMRSLLELTVLACLAGETQ